MSDEKSDNEKPKALEGEILPKESEPPTVPMNTSPGFTTLGGKWLNRKNIEAETRVELAHADKLRAQTARAEAATALGVAAAKLNKLDDITAVVSEGIEAELAETRLRKATASRSLTQEEMLSEAEATELEVRKLEAELKKKRLRAKLDGMTPRLEEELAAAEVRRQEIMDAWAARRESGAAVTEAEEDAYSQQLYEINETIERLRQKRAEEDN